MENLNKIFFQFVFHAEREICNYSHLDPWITAMAPSLPH